MSDLGGRLLAGTGWNVLGRGLPLLLALALTPLLVGLLGLERWGLFTLALAVAGVFGVFDLGLGQALTRAVAERLGAGRDAEVAPLVAAALAVLLGLSGGLAALGWFVVPVFVDGALQVPPALRAEAVAGFRLLLLAAPLIVVNAALWGILAAYGRFRAANLASIPTSALFYVGPVLLLPVWDSLVAAIAALVATRALNTVAYVWLLRPVLPALSWRRLRPALVLPLLRIGGWMTLSGVLTQALLVADRFLVGAMLTLAAVAYYATPLDLVLRGWILPVAVVQVLLPAMAAGYLAQPGATADLLRRGGGLVLAGALPPALLLAAAGDALLGLWLGAEFGAGGGMVLRIMGVGMLFSCVAFAPAALLDAIGRPDVTARFVLAQAALFLPLAAAGIAVAGIEGAAACWALRAAVDCGGKLLLAARLFPAAGPAARRLALPLGAAAVALPGLLLLAWPVALVVAVPLLGGFGWTLYRLLDPEERGQLGRLLRDPRAALGGRA